MQLDPPTIASIAGAYVGVKMIDHLLAKWLKQTDTSQFITKTECEKCSQKGHDQIVAIRAELRQELAPMRRLVVAMAIKMDVKTEDIQGLM